MIYRDQDTGHLAGELGVESCMKVILFCCGLSGLLQALRSLRVCDPHTTGVPEGTADSLRVAQASLVTIAHIFRSAVQVRAGVLIVMCVHMFRYDI